MEFICATTCRKRLLVPLPFGVARPMGLVTEIANNVSFGLFPSDLLMTRDQVELLKTDNVVSAEAVAEGRTLQGLGIEPDSYEAVAPSYLYRFRKAGQFERQGLA
jgi:NADH dehydrogenase